MNVPELEKAFREIITTSLGGPRGDPDRCHVECAFIAYEALVGLGIDVDSDDDLKDTKATLIREGWLKDG